MDDFAFLGKLFGQTPLSRVWVGWYDGTAGFPGGPADRYVNRLPAGAGHYFCIGSLKPGRVTRKLGDIELVHALVLDDIGTKAFAVSEIEARLGRPSWIVETSAGNFQWGWIYETPLGRSQWLMHRAVVGWCHHQWGTDMAGADPNRVVRLPSGVNTKPGRGGFRVKWREGGDWPVRVRLEDLALDLRLDGLSETELRLLGGKAPIKDLGDLTSVSLADAGHDVWVAAVVELGLARHDNANGTIEIECPWASDHSDLREGTAYLGGSRWKCQHDHCSGRKSYDFEREIESRLVEAGSSLMGLLVGMTPIGERAREDEYVAKKAVDHAFEPPPDGWPPPNGGGGSKSNRLTIWTETEAVDRLVYITGRRMFYDRVSKTLLTHDQVNDAMYPVREPATRGLKASHSVLLARGDLVGANHLTYRPGLGEIVNDALENDLAGLNTWKPRTLARAPTGKWLKVILRHIDRLFPDPDYARTMTNWLASLVQQPEVKIEWMPTIVGVGGTGKDLLFGMLRDLLGGSNVAKLDTERLLDEDSRVKAFSGRQVVILAELSMTRAVGRDVATLLKELITENQIFGRGIYEGAATRPNTASTLAYSNTENVLNLSHDDEDQRRYLPYISPARPLTKAEADELVEATELGVGELLGFLLDRDLVANGWDAHRKPDIITSKSAGKVIAEAGAPGPVKEIVELLNGPEFCDRTLVLTSEITGALRQKRVSGGVHAVGDGMLAGGFTRWKDTQTRFGAEGRSRVWVKKGSVDASTWTDDQMRAAVAGERAEQTAVVFADVKVVSMKKPGKGS